MTAAPPNPAATLPTAEEWAAFCSTEVLTQQEIVDSLSAMDPPEGMGPLTAHQARYIASAVWHRVKEHRNRTYALAFAHGVDHERHEAEDRRLRAEQA